MSKKLKMLRESKGYTQSELAEKVDVTLRTVSNWEKEDGITPNLETISRIAKSLDVSTFEIYKCFKIDPDSKKTKDDNSFQFNTHDIKKEPYRGTNFLGCSLFNYIKSNKISGNGIVMYKDITFYFMDFSLCENNDNDPIYNYFLPFNSIVFFDDNLNFIPIKGDDILQWTIKSDLNNVPNIEAIIKKPIFPEMNNDPNTECHTINLLFSKHEYSKDNYLLYKKKLSSFTTKKSDVIPAFIKNIRTKKELTQQEFANTICTFLGEIDNKTVSKWENGKLAPTLDQLTIICMRYEVSLEKLFNLYDNEIFIPDEIFKNTSYNLGLSYSFYEVTDTNSFVNFVQDYVITKNSIEGEFNDSSNICYIIFNKSDTPIFIRNLKVSKQNSELILLKDDGTETIISSNTINYISPISLHQNYFYEFNGEIESNGNKRNFTIIFSLFLE